MFVEGFGRHRRRRTGPPPVRTTGLHATVLLRDHRIVGMATGHRLSRLPRVHIDDLADEPVIYGAEAPTSSRTTGRSTPAPTAAHRYSDGRRRTGRECEGRRTSRRQLRREPICAVPRGQVVSPRLHGRRNQSRTNRPVGQDEASTSLRSDKTDRPHIASIRARGQPERTAGAPGLLTAALRLNRALRRWSTDSRTKINVELVAGERRVPELRGSRVVDTPLSTEALPRARAGQRPSARPRRPGAGWRRSPPSRLSRSSSSPQISFPIGILPQIAGGLGVCTGTEPGSARLGSAARGGEPSLVFL